MARKFSSIEIKHLVISVLVMSFAIAYEKSFLNTIVFMPFALIIIAPAFVFHELGHKFAAQKYGFFAEYRMWTQGLMLALFMAVATTWMGSKFLFIAPGAVYFGTRLGHTSLEKVAKVGLAGPIVNLILFFIFGVLWFSGGGILKSIGYMGMYVNSFLAVFNLIPFPPLDGQKIFAWSWKIWLFSIFLAGSALAFSSFVR